MPLNVTHTALTIAWHLHLEGSHSPTSFSGNLLKMQDWGTLVIDTFKTNMLVQIDQQRVLEEARVATEASEKADEALEACKAELESVKQQMKQVIGGHLSMASLYIDM